MVLVIFSVSSVIVFAELQRGVENGAVGFLLFLIPWLLITITTMTAVSMATRWRSIQTGHPPDIAKYAILAGLFCIFGLNPVSLMILIGLVALAIVILGVLGILCIVGGWLIGASKERQA